MMYKGILAAALLLLTVTARAEIVVVGPSALALPALTESEVQQIFKGKAREVDGQRVQPVDLPPGNEVRVAFYEQVLDKSPSQMRSYWARMTFTGKGKPPRSVSGSRELNALMGRTNAHYIGYMRAVDVTGNMSVLFRVPE